MRFRCKEDYSTTCAEYNCNACGDFPSDCGHCQYGEEKDGTEMIECILDMEQHSTDDSCSDFEPEYY